MNGLRRCGSIHSGILLSYKKEEIIPFVATWMQAEILILSEASQKEKDKYHMTSHIWNLIYGTNEPFHRKLMDLENRPVVSKGEEEGLGGTGNLGSVDANYCLRTG